jgi:hypothetical protein
VTQEQQPGPVLTEAGTRVAAALLARAWGPGARIREVAPIWGRGDVLRVRVALDRGDVLRVQGDAGRSVVLKRRRGPAQTFGVELAALEYLNQMPVPVAPRLVAADAAAGVLLMEDLGPGPSLADALLGGDRERAAAGLVSYAETLGTLQVPPGPSWLAALARGRAGFLGTMAALDLPAGQAAAEIDDLPFLLNGPGFTGLVHGDACPDNGRLRGGTCRVFDFETSGWGPVALDAAYLLAPFPSCSASCSSGTSRGARPRCGRGWWPGCAASSRPRSGPGCCPRCGRWPRRCWPRPGGAGRSWRYRITRRWPVRVRRR